MQTNEESLSRSVGRVPRRSKNIYRMGSHYQAMIEIEVDPLGMLSWPKEEKDSFFRRAAGGTQRGEEPKKSQFREQAFLRTRSKR